jgi:hypothetical protein
VNLLYLLPVLLSCLLLAAHCLRYGQLLLVIACLALPALLAVPRAWAARTVQVALIVGALEWARTTVVLMMHRLAVDEPWLRMVLILGAVTAVTASSALVFRTRRLRRRYRLPA